MPAWGGAVTVAALRWPPAESRLTTWNRAHLLLNRLGDGRQAAPRTPGPGAGHGHTGGPVRSRCGHARSGQPEHGRDASALTRPFSPTGMGCAAWMGIWAPVARPLQTQGTRRASTPKGLERQLPDRGRAPWCRPLLGHRGRPGQPSRPRPAPPAVSAEPRLPQDRCQPTAARPHPAPGKDTAQSRVPLERTILRGIKYLSPAAGRAHWRHGPGGGRARGARTVSAKLLRHLRAAGLVNVPGARPAPSTPLTRGPNTSLARV